MERSRRATFGLNNVENLPRRRRPHRPATETKSLPRARRHPSTFEAHRPFPCGNERVSCLLSGETTEEGEKDARSIKLPEVEA